MPCILQAISPGLRAAVAEAATPRTGPDEPPWPPTANLASLNSSRLVSLVFALYPHINSPPYKKQTNKNKQRHTETA